MASTTFADDAACRLRMATRTPAFARARAITLPSPPLPPVMTAVEPRMSKSVWRSIMLVFPQEILCILVYCFILPPNTSPNHFLARLLQSPKLPPSAAGRGEGARTPRAPPKGCAPWNPACSRSCHSPAFSRLTLDRDRRKAALHFLVFPTAFCFSYSDIAL